MAALKNLGGSVIGVAWLFQLIYPGKSHYDYGMIPF